MKGFTIFRTALLASAALVAACGGGGGSGSAPEAADASVSLAGGYASPLVGWVLVHPDGTVVGNHFGPGATSQQAFTGTFATAGRVATAMGARYAFTDMGGTTTAGSADVRLTLNAASDALQVDVTRAGAPAAFPSTTYGKVAPDEGLKDRPFSVMDGDYPPLSNTPNLRGVRVDTAAGTLAGFYKDDCEVSGRVYGYDSATTLFHLDATFTGAGCAVASYPVPTGSGQFIGRLSLDQATTNIRLLTFSAHGFLGDKYVAFGLVR